MLEKGPLHASHSTHSAQRWWLVSGRPSTACRNQLRTESQLSDVYRKTHREVGNLAVVGQNAGKSRTDRKEQGNAASKCASSTGKMEEWMGT